MRREEGGRRRKDEEERSRGVSVSERARGRTRRGEREIGTERRDESTPGLVNTSSHHRHQNWHRQQRERTRSSRTPPRLFSPFPPVLPFVLFFLFCIFFCLNRHMFGKHNICEWILISSKDCGTAASKAIYSNAKGGVWCLLFDKDHAFRRWCKVCNALHTQTKTTLSKCK